jgi:hypothetical protein
MQSSNGRVRAVVRSSRVPVDLTQFTMLTPSPAGFPATRTVRSVVYANVLDESQQRILDSAKRLAQTSDLDLEVVDLGKQNALRRVVSRILHGEEASFGEGMHLQVKCLCAVERAFNSSIR